MEVVVKLLQTLAKVPLMQNYGNRHTCGNFHPFKKDCMIVCVVKPLLISKSELEISAPGWGNLCLCQVYEYKLQCLQSIFSYC